MCRTRLSTRPKSNKSGFLHLTKEEYWKKKIYYPITDSLKKLMLINIPNTTVNKIQSGEVMWVALGQVLERN